MAAIPSEMIEKIYFFLGFIINPWILSAFFAAFLASLSWMAALTKFTLSYAYPFMSLTFILVTFMSSILFKEAITISKTISLGLIIAALIIGTRSN
ncbi:MAG: EamA family transporter [Nostoc sp.]|uniref:EamA family transporter n=1 Tax=unclassified Nostoc TaxID=2593658 RepID=UPI0025FBA5EB|nr:EamA family transporter [Nostoc sp. NMS9]